MTDEEIRKILGDARAFRETAELAEEHIRTLGARPDTRVSLFGNKGWPSADVWMSLKTASHFNLHNALELGLKSFLELLDTPFPHMHSLSQLYALIPKTEADELRALFTQTQANRTIELRAFIRTPGLPSPPTQGPQIDRVQALKGFLAYFDNGMGLWKKRYSWEEASQEKWEHYLTDLTVFFEFFDHLWVRCHDMWHAKKQPQ